MASQRGVDSRRAHHLFVVSDLHLGGRPANGDGPGFQMCPPEARRRLARFVHQLAAGGTLAPVEDSIELVINGDFIDFLAEEPFQDFTGPASSALEKLTRAISTCDEGAPEQEQVFAALRELVGRGHKLTILLGNHDLEQSIPAVRRSLLNTLTRDKPARVELIFDGEAYRVGDVLIEHGNRYDGWNAVAYGALRAFRSSSSRDETPWPFQPPAGSRLVTAVMNPIKTRYRFIDLLKPENETVIPILCALEPALASELAKVVPLWLAKRKATGKAGRVRPEETLIAAGGKQRQTEANGAEISVAPEPPGIESLVGDHLDEHTQRVTAELLDAAVRTSHEIAREAWGNRVPPGEGNVASGPGAWLASKLSLSRLGKEKPPTRYRWLAKALADHAKAIRTTFDLASDDPPYSTAARRLVEEGDVRLVILGHTHLPKAIPLGSRGHYLNTGTWCPTIRMEPRFYEGGEPDPKMIEDLIRFVDDLAANRLAPWTRIQTLFAHVRLDHEGGSHASLCEFQGDGTVKRHFHEEP